jgi:hypothetical protein
MLPKVLLSIDFAGYREKMDKSAHANDKSYATTMLS